MNHIGLGLKNFREIIFINKNNKITYATKLIEYIRLMEVKQMHVFNQANISLDKLI